MTLSMRVGHLILPMHLDTTDIPTDRPTLSSRKISIDHPSVGHPIEHFYHGHGLFLLLAMAAGFYMLKVPNWERVPPKY